MSPVKSAVLAVCAWLAIAPSARAEVQVSLRNGRVTIVARDATLRQILTEWARVGKTTVINLERIPGGPLTLELRDVPESQALDILLRALSGYIVSPRVAFASDVSMFDSISVMPTLAPLARAAGPGSSAPAPFTPPPTFTANDEDENTAGRNGNGPQPVRPPTFGQFPNVQPPQVGNPNSVARPVLPVVRPGTFQPQPSANPNDPQPQVAPFPFQVAQPTQGGPAPGPVGVAAPGMIAPAASQPGQVPQRPPGE
ncbi:MAG TPA: hypothetical protein VLV86_07755 [Vicinamibacterales bacterium]|nr:hypothetical protein [Vicinamibacterales bacterium]